MRLPYDVSRCYGNKDGAVCPSRDTCARYVQLADGGYNTPASMHLCRTTGRTFAEFYIKQPGAMLSAGEKDGNA